MDAGPVDQRDRQCPIRVSGLGGRLRKHLVAERAAKPAHTLVNDPVADAPAEAIYIRDEESGDLWSATPLPIREPSSTYVIRHGFGYSRFEHTSHGIGLDLLQFVPLVDSLKISRLKIVNQSAQN